MQSAIEIDARDERKLMGQFQRLEHSTRHKLGRRAVNAGGTVMLRAARQEAPVGPTGNLRASMGNRTRNYKESSTAVAVIGARISGAKRGFHAHLVHDGHIAQDGSYVPGNPFMDRAARRSERDAYKRMGDKLADDIRKEAGK